MLRVCGGDNRIDSKGKEDNIMAEAVGLESESVETEGPDTDGPGGPDTQQEGNNTGNS